MHVLVATDGKVDPEDLTRLTVPMAGSEGDVTVLTVVEIPRRLLSDLRAVMGGLPEVEVHRDAEYVGAPSAADDQLRGWPGDDTVINQYLANKNAEYTGPAVAALRAAGAKATGIAVEGENAAETILSEAEKLEADVVVIGSHGQGLFQGLLGGTGTKIVRRSTRPVLLIRN